MTKTALKLRNWILTLIILGLMGCSSDLERAETSGAKNGADFVVIGEDLNSVFQYSYNSESDFGTTNNLTEEIEILPSYLTLVQQNEVLSFYSFAQGAFSLALKNVSTEDTKVFENFYINTPERSITWGVNNEANVFFGYFGAFGNGSFSLYDVELEGATREDVTVDFNVGATFRPLLFKEKVYMAFRDNLGDYKLTCYDPRTMSKGPILNFGSVPISFFNTESGNIAVIKNEFKGDLEIYNPEDLSFRESFAMDISFGFAPGMIDDAILSGNELYFNMIYPQPSRFVKGPAVYNLATKEAIVLDMSGLVGQVEAQIGKAINFTTQVYDPFYDVFLMGYGTFGEDVEGGVIIASVEGELLKQTTLPFFPTYFLKN